MTFIMKRVFSLANKLKRKSRQVWTAIKTLPTYRAEFGFSPAVIMLRRNASLISAEDYIQAMSEYVMKELTPVTQRYLGGYCRALKRRFTLIKDRSGFAGFREKRIFRSFAKPVLNS